MREFRAKRGIKGALAESVRIDAGSAIDEGAPMTLMRKFRAKRGIKGALAESVRIDAGGAIAKAAPMTLRFAQGFVLRSGRLR
jgi:hypothetical protein